MESKPETHAQRTRNALILIYMLGNAATFAKLISAQATEIRSTGELLGPVSKGLALSMVWPLYWLWRLLFD